MSSCLPEIDDSRPASPWLFNQKSILNVIGWWLIHIGNELTSFGHWINGFNNFKLEISMWRTWGAIINHDALGPASLEVRGCWLSLKSTKIGKSIKCVPVDIFMRDGKINKLGRRGLHGLNKFQNQNQKVTCKMVLQCHRREGILYQIVIDDESRIYLERGNRVRVVMIRGKCWFSNSQSSGFENVRELCLASSSICFGAIWLRDFTELLGSWRYCRCSISRLSSEHPLANDLNAKSFFESENVVHIDLVGHY